MIIYPLKNILETLYKNEISTRYNTEDIIYESSSSIFVNGKELNKSEIKDIQRTAEKDLIEFFKENFHCKKNKDIELFLHDYDHAVRFQKENKARTFIITNDRGLSKIYGYFTLSILLFGNKTSKEEKFISNTKLRKLQGYCASNNEMIYWGFLIAQLGRNDNVSKELLDLEKILSFIKAELAKSKEVIGGNIIMLEAVNNEKLIKKYEEVGFKYLQTVSPYKQLFIWDEEY